jgi:hypothetical protein
MNIDDRQPNIIQVEVHFRYAVWPGGRAMCVIATAEKVGEAMYLVDAESGAVSVLKPYRLGMFGRRCW